MDPLTGFGLYLVIVNIFSICASLYAAGQGGSTSSPGVLIFAAIWCMFNTLGIILWGTGTGL